MDSKLKKLIKQSASSDKALSALEEELFRSDLLAKALGGTTQAVDIINGGVKVNALPEEVFAIVNHRIATHRYSNILFSLIHTVTYSDRRIAPSRPSNLV